MALMNPAALLVGVVAAEVLMVAVVVVGMVPVTCIVRPGCGCGVRLRRVVEDTQLPL